MSCRLIWSQRTQRVYHGRSAGRVRVFFNRARGTSSLLRIRLLRISVSLASSRQPDRNQSCRTFIRSGRREMCSDVPAPVLPRVLLHSRTFFRVGRREHVDRRVLRLMSPRHSRARVCLWQHLRTAVSAPSPPYLPLLFNRLSRILSLDRADTARRTCIYALLSPHDRISWFIYERVICNTTDDFESYQIAEKVDLLFLSTVI